MSQVANAVPGRQVVQSGRGKKSVAVKTLGVSASWVLLDAPPAGLQQCQHNE